MKIIGRLLLFLWQLPQNVLAQILIGFLSLLYGRPTISEHRGIEYVWFDGWRNGVSLGSYVLLGDWAVERLDIVQHEWGHTRQSLFFGPLYLILIGMPSGLGNLWDRLFHTEKKGWSRAASSKWYYNQPWEKWADRLGGVERHY